MSSESIAPELAIGLVVLIAYVLLARGRRAAAMGSSLLAAIIGAVAYPLARCVVMGIAAGSMLQPGGAWSRFQYAYVHFGESAPAESIPRGAVLGVLTVACWALWRRSRTRPPVVADSLPPRANSATQSSAAKQGVIPELAEPPRRRNVGDYLRWAAAGALAAIVLLIVLPLALEHGHPRIVGPPHWSDKYFRAAATAFWVVVVALLVFGLWRDYWPK